MRRVGGGLPRICAIGVAALLLPSLNASPGLAADRQLASLPLRASADRSAGYLPEPLPPRGARPGRLAVAPRVANPYERTPNPVELRGGRIRLAQMLEPVQPYVPLTGTSIRIRFDGPVSRTKVERTFHLEPAAKGTLSWEDARTLVYRTEAYAYDTVYTVELAATDPEDEIVGGWQWQFDTVKPITLTFDDCGTSTQLKTVLSVLAQKHLKAIMFPIGWCAATYPWLVPQMLAEGHLVCNHTYSHPPLTVLTDAQMISEIQRGVHAGCNLLRPPNGNWDGPDGRVARIAAQLGYQIYMWDVDTHDYEGASTTFILNSIKARGGVILLHFHGKYTIDALRLLQV